MKRMPFRLATAARACGFRANRKDWTIGGIPVRGGKVVVHHGLPGRAVQSTTSRAPARGNGKAVNVQHRAVEVRRGTGRARVYVVVSSPDGRQVVRALPWWHEQRALHLLNEFTAASTP